MYKKYRAYFLTIILMFATIYLMNVFTPLLADDYCYTYVGGMTEEKVTTFSDLFRSAQFYGKIGLDEWFFYLWHKPFC